MQYWLMKSEPNTFSIEDLRNRPTQTEPWDGVRNYQARNFMRDNMQQGDLIFFYHSNCKIPSIVGIAEVASPAAYPDPTQFDVQSDYYDPKAVADRPIWMLVDIRFVRQFSQPISLAQLQCMREALGDFALLRRGNRLSVMPVSAAQWQYIMNLAI